MSRTYRHKLTGGKAVLHSCRNHGTCPWCTRNRTYTSLRGLEQCRQQLKELAFVDNLKFE